MVRRKLIKLEGGKVNNVEGESKCELACREDNLNNSPSHASFLPSAWLNTLDTISMSNCN
jgi:hypothetical protein